MKLEDYATEARILLEHAEANDELVAQSPNDLARAQREVATVCALLAINNTLDSINTALHTLKEAVAGIEPA